MCSFKEIIRNIIDGTDEDNPNGITLYKGAIEILEQPWNKDVVGDLGTG